MAKKGQKYNNYAEDLKIEIITEFQEGASSNYLAQKYGISRFTILCWIRKIKKPELYPGLGQGRGRSKKLETLEDYKERYEILKKYRAFLKAQREKK